jgi:hypothetical protein
MEGQIFVFFVMTVAARGGGGGFGFDRRHFQGETQH